MDLDKKYNELHPLKLAGVYLFFNYSIHFLIMDIYL